MEIFKTPFSREYWRCAVRDSNQLRIQLFSALMVAVCVALSYLGSPPVVNNIGVKWGYLARALSALVGGPVMGILFGAVEDTVSFMFNPKGAYNPFYMFTTVLGVFTYALFFYRAQVTVLRIFLAKLVINIQNVFVGGLGTYLWYSGGKGYWVIVTGSAVKNAIMLPVETVLLTVLFAALLPVLHRMGYLPDQVAHLRTWKDPEQIDRKKDKIKRDIR